MTKLSDKARASYLQQRPDRRIIDVREHVAPQPAAPPEAATPELGPASLSDSARGLPQDDKVARLREKFLGQRSIGADSAPDSTSNGPLPHPKKHSTFVVTDAGGQIKVDIVDPETGEIEMEQG